MATGAPAAGAHLAGRNNNQVDFTYTDRNNKQVTFTHTCKTSNLATFSQSKPTSMYSLGCRKRSRVPLSPTSNKRRKTGEKKGDSTYVDLAEDVPEAWDEFGLKASSVELNCLANDRPTPSKMSTLHSIITLQKHDIARRKRAESQHNEKVERMQNIIDDLKQQVCQQRDDAEVAAARASAELKDAEAKNESLDMELTDERESLTMIKAERDRESARAIKLENKLRLKRQDNKAKQFRISTLEREKKDSKRGSLEDAESAMDVDDPLVAAQDKVQALEKQVEKLEEARQKASDSEKRLRLENKDFKKKLKDKKDELAQYDYQLSAAPCESKKSGKEALDAEMEDVVPSVAPGTLSISTASINAQSPSPSNLGSSISSFASSGSSKASTVSTAHTSPLSSVSKSPMASSEVDAFELIDDYHPKSRADRLAAQKRSKSGRFDPLRAKNSGHRVQREVFKGQQSAKRRAQHVAKVVGAKDREGGKQKAAKDNEDKPRQDRRQLKEEEAADDDEDETEDESKYEPKDEPEEVKLILWKTGPEFSDEENDRRTAANRDLVYVAVKQAYSDGKHQLLKKYRGQWLATSDESTRIYLSLHPNAADIVLAEMVSQDGIDKEQTPYLPFYDKIRIKIENQEDDRDEGDEIDTDDFTKQCVMAHFPELHMQAAAGALVEDRQTYDKFAAKYERERGKAKAAPEQKHPLFKSAWRRARMMLAGMNEFREACTAWANDEPAKGKWCWPPTFKDPEVVKKTSLTPEADVAANKAAEEADAMADIFKVKSDVDLKPQSIDAADPNATDDLASIIGSSSFSTAERKGRGGCDAMFGPTTQVPEKKDRGGQNGMFGPTAD